MQDLARALGHEVCEQSFKARVRGFSVRAPGMIFITPEPYAPRREFTLAHEIIELHLPRSFLEHLPPNVKESLCDRGAAALLLPPAAFLFELQKCDWSLPVLRKTFPRASYETIATRIVDLKPGATAAAWVHGKRAWWRGPASGANVRDLVLAERAALRIAHRSGAARVEMNGIVARAWRLTARGKRVALTVCQREPPIAPQRPQRDLQPIPDAGRARLAQEIIAARW